MDQLRRFAVTCFRKSDAGTIRSGALFDCDALDSVPMFARRLSDVSSDDDYVFLRTFVIAERSRQVVVRRATHRLPDAVGSKASLGCLGFVKRGDKTMFSADALGLVDASVRTVSEQLYFAARDVKLVREQHLLRLIGLMAAPQDVTRTRWPP